MKSLKAIFAMTITVILVMTSCSKENAIIESQKEGNSIEFTDEYRENRLNELANSDNNVTVEHATLDEINEVMIELGLDTYTQSDIEQIVESRMTIYNCEVWNRLGDWSGDGVLNTDDLFEAYYYLCETDCGGTLDMFVGTHPTEAYDFSWMTGLENGTEWWDLNWNDIDAVVGRILNNIPCNN